MIMISFFMVLASCDFQEQWMLDVPGFTGNSILTGTTPLSSDCGYALEGIYIVDSGNDLFGDTLVLKDTRGKISLFGYKNSAYFILGAGSTGSEIRMEGYWRFAQGDETGLARLTITGASQLIAGDTTISNITIDGTYSQGNSIPDKSLSMHLLSRFTWRLRTDPFIIGAHRGGGRTSDRLPVSENSVEMINYTRHFGSTGIEIDVQLTRDRVPVLYHDGELNVRLIQKGPVLGKIADYNYSQLATLVRLIHGETIPTLRQALDAAYSNPEIRTVWLDMKDPAAVQYAVPIQLEYLDKASKEGRELQILIGIPDQDVFDNFTAYPGYKNIPSLCEISVEKVEEINAKAWGFRWTQGLMQDEVIMMHSQGRKCLVWTLDDPQFTAIYSSAGGSDPQKRFDGILTNYPTVLSYFHYARHNY